MGPQSAEKDYRRLRGVVNQRISEASDNISRSVPALLITMMILIVSRPGTLIGLVGCKHSHLFKQIGRAQWASAM